MGARETVLEFELAGAGGEPVDLWRTCTSHGFAALPPMSLDEAGRTLEITLPVRGGRPRTVRIREGRPGHAEVASLGPRPGPRTAGGILAAARHVLRMDEDLRAFYDLADADADLTWVGAGAGRMLRSPTIFEDVVKTICTTNCAWSATERMVGAIVENLGEPATGPAPRGPLGRAFPTAEAMASAGESFYRDVARAGYRGRYLLELSRAVAAGEVDLERVGEDADLPDERLEAELLSLPGVGPYAAAHIMMTIGRYSRLILDSWTRPTYARLVGRRSVPDRAILRRFHRYGPYAGLAFLLFLTREWVED